jgi:hypothetical protein
MISGTLRQYTPVCVGLAMATLMTMCPTISARAETETRATAPFHAISFEGSWSVDVTVGKDQSVVLEGDKDMLPHVQADVVDGQLHIALRSDWKGSDTSKLKAHITVPTLTAFALRGSGTANVAGLSGGTTEFALKGSGDLTADGHVDALALVVSGSGNADLSRLVAGKATATINGSGDAKLKPNESLAAVVNGSGQVIYSGDSVKVTSVVNGSGGVEKR